jgi:hypothetical protein
MPHTLTQSERSEVRNEKLYGAVRSYVAAVTELVRSAFDSQSIPNPAVQGVFSFSHLSDEISSLPQYKDCHEKILEDSVIAGQLGVLTGRPGIVRQSWDAAGLMRQLPMLGIAGDRLEFNETRFEMEYDKFEASFYGDALEYEVIAPLSGVSFERNIKIDDGIEICLVDSTGSKVTRQEGGTDRSVFPKYGWAVRTTYSLPKLVGRSDTSEAAVNLVEETRQAANDAIDKVVTVLRLLQASHAAAVQKLHRTRSWVFSEQWAPPVTFQPDQFFTLDTGENFAEAVVWLWKALANPNFLSQKHLTVAAKRFSYAHERIDWEDRIIDLFIAAEALFLSTTGNQSELKYRLRLHAALFLGSDITTRKQIFDDMGLAYDLRSAIVHGSAPDSKIDKIKKKEVGRFGDKYKLLEFSDRIQEYIRFSIVSMVRRAGEELGAIDWESLVLGDASELKRDAADGSGN